MPDTVFLKDSAEDQILDLAYYISKLRDEEGEENAPYIQEAKALLASEKKNDVYVQLARDASIFLIKPDREVEGAFNLTIVIALSAPDQSEPVKTLVKTLVRTPTTTEKMASLKQKILLNLYNALPSTSPLRYDAFIGLVDVTAAADELNSLIPQLDNIDTWAKQWGISKDQENTLYEYISLKLQAAGEEKLSLELSLKVLATREDETELAKAAVLRAVDMENYFAFEDLLQYTAIQKLKGTPEFDLFDVFLNGNLTKYKEFASSHPNLIHNDENKIRKMRLLSLASLGSENLARELSYDEIAHALEIPEEEVEMWVIDVIRAGLVEAKLDQLNRTVIVHRSIYRVFGKDQWQQLSARLSSWKDGLNDVLRVVGNARSTAAGALQGDDKAQGEVTVKSN